MSWNGSSNSRRIAIKMAKIKGSMRLVLMSWKVQMIIGSPKLNWRALEKKLIQSRKEKPFPKAANCYLCTLSWILKACFELVEGSVKQNYINRSDTQFRWKVTTASWADDHIWALASFARWSYISLSFTRKNLLHLEGMCCDTQHRMQMCYMSKCGHQT